MDTLTVLRLIEAVINRVLDEEAKAAEYTATPDSWVVAWELDDDLRTLA